MSLNIRPATLDDVAAITRLHVGQLEKYIHFYARGGPCK